MAKFTVNNVELEFDVFELENAEKLQTELIKIQNMGKDLKGESDIAKAIKKQCTTVFNFIDTLFGEGKHKEIFGESVNLKTCTQVFAQIVTAINSDKDDYLGSLPQANRETRRATKK